MGRLLLRTYGIPREVAPLVTESSIVNDNRNRGKTRDRIEDELIETLGVEKVVRPAGVRGEDITPRPLSLSPGSRFRGVLVVRTVTRPDGAVVCPARAGLTGPYGVFTPGRPPART